MFQAAPWCSRKLRRPALPDVLKSLDLFSPKHSETRNAVTGESCRRNKGLMGGLGESLASESRIPPLRAGPPVGMRVLG